MQAAARSYYIDSRTQPEMICIAEYDARIKVVFKRLETHALNCASRANRHEDRRLDNSAARSQHSGARFAVAGKHFESDGGLVRHVSQT